MGKFAAFLALSLSAGVYASEQTQPLEVDINALPDCSQLSDEIIYGNEAFTCVSKRDISNEELVKEHLSNFKIAPDPEGTQYINLSELPTQFILNNKGGYNARMIVTHYQINPIDGKWIRLENITSSIPLGNKTSITVPDRTVRAHVKIQRHGALKWETIVDQFIRQNENRWVANDNSKNMMQWDVWGTIFNSPHKQVQPAGTYDYFGENNVFIYSPDK